MDDLNLDLNLGAGNSQAVLTGLDKAAASLATNLAGITQQVVQFGKAVGGLPGMSGGRGSAPYANVPTATLAPPGFGGGSTSLVNLDKSAIALTKTFIGLTAQMMQFGRSLPGGAGPSGWGPGGAPGHGGLGAWGSDQSWTARKRKESEDEERRMDANMKKNAEKGGAFGAGAKIGGGVMIGMKMVTGAANKFTEINEGMNDPSSSAYQKRRGLNDAIPVIGKFVNALEDAANSVTGLTADFKASKLEHQMIMAKEPLKQAAVAYQNDTTFERRGMEVPNQVRREDLVRAGGGRGTTMTPAIERRARAAMQQSRYEHLTSGIDDNTVEGEREGRARERTLPMFEAKREADLDREGALRLAKEARLKASGYLKDADIRENAANKFLKKGKKDTDTVGGQEGKRINLRDAEIALSDAGRSRLEAQKAITEAKRQELIASTALERSLATQREIDKDRLNTLGEQLGQAKSAAQVWARMTGAEKAATMQSIEQVKKGGMSSASEAQRADVEKFAPEVAQREYEKMAKSDPTFTKANDMLDRRSDIDAMTKEKRELTANIGVDLIFDKDKVADELAKKIGPLFDALIKNFALLMEAKVKEIDVKFGLAHAG